MANFDTQAKRFSGMGMGAWEAPLLPKPDATIAQGDRQHFLDLYSGILAAAPVIPSGDAIAEFRAQEWHPRVHAPPVQSGWSFSLIFPQRPALGGFA